MHTIEVCVCAFGAVFLSGAALRGQCTDPKTPPAGFQITVQQDRLVTYTDGYRTKADVRYPTVAPASCGWPMLVAVHGFPGSKQGTAADARSMAQRGYCVVNYDVRGQGSAIALNPGRGTTVMGFNEWIDMFEMIEWAARTYPKLVDLRRVGVFGISQGGAHSWAAAAWSGQTPPTNPRRKKAFPIIRAAVPFVMAPSHTEVATLGGTAFKQIWARHAFGLPNRRLAIDPKTQQVWQRFLLNDDPEGNAAWMRNDPGRDFIKLLAKSTTAVFVMHAWRDILQSPNLALRTLTAMPAQTPRRIFLTTTAHGSALNDYEWNQAKAMRLVWFNRFLKAGTEPIEAGPPVLSAAVPADHAAYLSRSTLWRHRADMTFPPNSAVTSTFYLRSGAALSAAAPTSNETPERVTHRLPPGYNARSWLADGSGAPITRALAKIPLSSHSYTTAPLAREIEIAGIPKLVLAVTPKNPRFLLAARLEIVTANGGTQIISEGGLGVRQPGAAKPAVLSIALSAIDTVVPKGARLRLSVRNHFLVKSTTTESFRFMPYFSAYAVDLEHSPKTLSRLVLPLRPERSLDLSTASMTIAIASPAAVTLRLRSSTAQARASYVVLGSLSGQGPALVLPGGDRLYLVPDAVTSLFFGALGTPPLSGFTGVLDARGGATASLNLASVAPLPSGLVGLDLQLVAVALRGARVETAAPLTLTFR